jgi:hypothetical protein
LAFYVREPPETRKEAGTGCAHPFVQLLGLLVATGAGSATVGRGAARCVCRLCRSCETERDNCYQQNCSDALHGFSPLKIKRVLVDRWQHHRQENERHFWWRFLNTKEVRFEESISAALPNGWNKFPRLGKPSDQQIKIGGRNKIVRRGDSQRRCVPLLNESYLEGTTGDAFVGIGFAVLLLRGGRATRMVAVFHVDHQPQSALTGRILLERRCVRNCGEGLLFAAQGARQDSHPQRDHCGHSHLHDVRG